ncbi:MAG: hypothetical protein VYE68_07330 [Acidobacteriota bacterium]|nr:hypothetical protein [Acidobacteriota bacterium]
MMARQNGPWVVRLQDPELAAWTTPEFLRAGDTYTFTWLFGTSEQHEVTAVANDGWVRVSTPNTSEKWLNASMTVSIERVEA